MASICSLCLKLVYSAVLISAVAWASGPVGQSSTSLDQPTTGTAGSSSHYLQIAINPSTSHIIEGAVYGLDADIQNTSSLPVVIDFSQMQLAVQPELAPPTISCTWFYDAVVNSKVPSPLVMQPGDHFVVFFDTGSAATSSTLKDTQECQATSWERLRRQLDFVPGNYSFVVTGTFGTLPPPVTNSTSNAVTKTQPGASLAEPTNSDKHYFTETAILPVTIDQAQIILYAGIGGLLAFLVMSFRSAGTLWEYAAQGKKGSASDTRLKRALFILRSASAAILVSVTVTVIASRLSTTSFPVKVSVDDFWGALTIGFVSYFIGGKFIDKLSDTLSPGTAASPAVTLPAAATMPAADTTPAADSTTPAADTTPAAGSTTPAADATPAAGSTTLAADATPAAGSTTPAADATPAAGSTPAN